MPPASITPETLSITAVSPLVITLPDPSLNSLFKQSQVRYFTSNSALNQAAPSFIAPARIIGDSLFFNLPKDLKTGTWIIDISLIPLDIDSTVPNFGLTKTVEVVQ